MIRITTVFLLFHHIVFCQLFNNPSFEGKPGASVSPANWYPCNEFSTPDTQPGSWNVSTKPADGQSYLSLVTRGVFGETKDGTKEAIGTVMKGFTPGKTYTMSIDLAFAADFDDLWYPPNWKPIRLQIYAGNDYCDKRVEIWSSEEISHAEWRTYGFEFQPTESYSYFIMEANYSGIEPYLGNILVDHLRGYEGNGSIQPGEDRDVIVSDKCKVGLPTIFTPNHDGFNDDFKIQYEVPIQRVHFAVFNRWGRLVYVSSEIDASWDGNMTDGSQASSGIYYWVLNCFCLDVSNLIQDENLKGWVTLLRD